MMVFSQKGFINNGFFLINFVGDINKNDNNLNSIKEFSYNYFKSIKKIDDEKKFIGQVINIFRDFKKTHFDIKINIGSKTLCVEYKDLNLIKLNLIEEKKDGEKLEFDYSVINGVSIKYNEKYAQKEDDNLKFHVQYYLNDIFNMLNSLSTIKPKYITNNQKIIINIYELFYGKNPDFSSINIEKEIQNMMYILKEYSISLEGSDDFDFHYNEPRSYYIHKLLKDLVLPKSCLDELKNTKLITPSDKKMIKLIGSEINSYLAQFKEEDRLNEFNKLCVINETKKYRVSNWATNEEIIDSSNIKCEEKDVTNTLKLIKNINKKRTNEVS